MVKSYTQLLAKRYQDRLDETAQEFISYAVNGVSRMQTLISDLLTYSRVGAQGWPTGRVEAEEALRQALVNLKVALEESGAGVTSGPLPQVVAGEGQLVQLFQNLIGNAVKFRGQEPPRIHVAAERRGAEWVFSVIDNGLGIEPGFRERIFLIFQRLHGKEKPGTGIGLAICQKIVERCGGRIWVESQPGQGSTFFFTIPDHDTEDKGDGAQQVRDSAGGRQPR